MSLRKRDRKRMVEKGGIKNAPQKSGENEAKKR
mgnify:CR=1 FL=1